MPSFLCCSTSIRSIPISPDSAPATSRSQLSKKELDAVPDDGEFSRTTGHKQKLRAIINETLLPGQLPDTPRGAAKVQILEPDKKKGVPLLEDTLSDSQGTRSWLASADGSLGLLTHLTEASTLAIPAQLCSTSATFDADYRNGEQVTSPTSVSNAARRCSSTSDSERAASLERGAVLSVAVDGIGFLRQILEAPLQRALSRASGQWRLYKVFPKVPKASLSGGAGPQADGAVGPPHPAASEAALVPSTALTGPASEAIVKTAARHGEPATGNPSLQQCASFALRQLQQELHLATQLPPCPQLLLPYRVYQQPSSVHVVYDGAGEFTELLAYLNERHRLPERQCRSILRQLLLALAALHADLWAHRSISLESVWVAEQPKERPPRLTGEPEPCHRVSEPNGAAATAAAAAAVDTAADGGRGRVTCTATISLPGLGPAGTSVHGSSTESPERRDVAANGSSQHGDGRQYTGPERGSRHDDERPSPQGGAPAADKVARRRERHARLLVKLGGLRHAAQEKPDPGGDRQAQPTFRELVGCPYHLAPEAIRGLGYGRPADIWAAGVLLFMLLTGRPPFPGQNELEVMTRVLLMVAETEAAAADAATKDTPADLQPGASSTATAGPNATLGRGQEVGRKASMCAGVSSRSVGAASSMGPDGAGRPRRKIADSVQELVVQAALESCASAACREALAGMLEVDPARRMSAAALLRLPWFTSGEEKEREKDRDRDRE